MDCYLVTYDIPDDRRRTKMANLLQDYGQRVQYSVFEVWLNDATQRELLARLKAILVEEDDSVRLYALCAACQKRVITLGQGTPPAAPGVVII